MALSVKIEAFPRQATRHSIAKREGLTGAVDEIGKSEFFKWRALFAAAHADHKVSVEERLFMEDVLRGHSFSDEQKKTLRDDVAHAKDMKEMFLEIKDPKERLDFFVRARKLFHIDGDFDKEEQAIIMDLQRAHISGTVVDDLVNVVDLQLEEEPKKSPKPEIIDETAPRGFAKILNFFFKFFSGR